MSEPLKLMCILAHPDDESLGFGGTLAKYGAEGVETYLVTATRGERGWMGPPKEYPGLEELGRIRESELEQAIQILGIKEQYFLDYIDGELDAADPAAVIPQLVAFLRRIRPDVVATFDPNGAYGHPDHIAICQFSAAAIQQAANPAFLCAGLEPHSVSKFYFRTWTRDEHAGYMKALGDLRMNIDGTDRSATSWHDWAITTRINTSAYWSTVLEAISCHRSQLPEYQKLISLPDEYHEKLWGCDGYYRVFSTVNGGRDREDDLFAGLR
jgi:LmbE family N-acetylglucosaminyl deacetylase